MVTLAASSLNTCYKKILANCAASSTMSITVPLTSSLNTLMTTCVMLSQSLLRNFSFKSTSSTSIEKTHSKKCYASLITLWPCSKPLMSSVTRPANGSSSLVGSLKTKSTLSVPRNMTNLAMPRPMANIEIIAYSLSLKFCALPLRTLAFPSLKLFATLSRLIWLCLVNSRKTRIYLILTL